MAGVLFVNVTVCGVDVVVGAWPPKFTGDGEKDSSPAKVNESTSVPAGTNICPPASAGVTKRCVPKLAL